MRPRWRVTVQSVGAAQDQPRVYDAVFRVDLREGSLLLDYDGEDGPEQAIHAPGTWVKVTTKLEPGPRG